MDTSTNTTVLKTKADSQQELIKPEEIRTPAVQKYIKRVSNPFLFRLYLWWKLPMGAIAGLKIKELTTNHAVTAVPYRWLNQNPFRSTYFAVLSMAAELSMGILALMAVENAGQPVSTLITGMNASFNKKATGITTFTCMEGQRFFDAVKETLHTGEGVEFKVETIGKNEEGMEVARFEFIWSIKKK